MLESLQSIYNVFTMKLLQIVRSSHQKHTIKVLDKMMVWVKISKHTLQVRYEVYDTKYVTNGRIFSQVQLK